jgi:hypothetical protein
MTEPNTVSIYESVPLPLGKIVFIRLITIQPSLTSDGSDRISCDFHLLDLDTKLLHNPKTSLDEKDRIQYTALAYTWGEPPSTETIDLNETPTVIRKNLQDFLIQARENGLSDYI